MSEYVKTLKMNRTRKYPAYQFYYKVRYKGETADVCMHYTILLVENWLTDKTGVVFEDTSIRHTVDNFRLAAAQDFQSKHIVEGYVLDITSVLEKEYWAMRLREPDSNTNDRKAVMGRFIETEVGLHIFDEEWIEVGIQINSIDPESAEELPYGYRPAFVLKMFSNPELQIVNIDDLDYNNAFVVDSENDLDRFSAIVKSTDNYMPIVCFIDTNEKVDIRMLLNMIDDKLGSDASNSMLKHFESFENASQVKELDKYYMVYEPDRFTKYSLGYARVFHITHNIFTKFRDLFDEEMDYGDVVWISPRVHSNDVIVFPYKDHIPPRNREKLISSLLDNAHKYTKNKEYDFHGVLFEYDLRSLKHKVDLENIRDRIHTESEKEIYGLAENLVALNERKIEELEKENAQLRSAKYSLEQRVKGLSNAKHESQEDLACLINIPGINELYRGEINDLIISVLVYALDGYALEGSRANELMQEIITNRKILGKGKVMFDALKSILCGIKNVTDSDISDIKKIGFSVSRLESGHLKIFIEGGDKYYTTIPGTGSDERGLKNSFSDLIKRASVYK